MTACTGFNKLQLNRPIESLGVIITDIDLNGTGKIRFKLEGTVGNQVDVRFKLKGQSSYTDIQTIEVGTEYVINASTYDFIELECVTFTGNFKLLASGDITYGS